MDIWTWLGQLFSSRSKTTEDTDMKYLIAGLGNMGAEYDNTRHNVGFEVVDRLAERFDVTFEHESHGDLGEFKYKGRTFILLKPSTYMNRSGKAVRYWLQKKKVKQSNLLVIVDDLALDLGTLRLRGKGSDGGHNGLKDVNQMLGNTNYARLRVGIGDDFHKGQQVDYVLGKWTASEQKKLETVLDRAAECVLSFATIGLSLTMSEFNG